MSIYIKLALGVVLLALLGTGIWYYGHCEYVAGENATQVKWDKSKQSTSNAVVKAVENGVDQTQKKADALDTIEANYIKANTYVLPTLADSLSSAYSAGTLQLRDQAPVQTAVCRGTISQATADSRAADAAATQALADRVQDSIAAVRAGDEADKREQLLGNQVTALQKALQADRVNGN